MISSHTLHLIVSRFVGLAGLHCHCTKPRFDEAIAERGFPGGVVPNAFHQRHVGVEDERNAHSSYWDATTRREGRHFDRCWECSAFYGDDLERASGDGRRRGGTRSIA